jgi:N6-L-threonylcarbamoyladenine synthase
MHTEWISAVVGEALNKAGLEPGAIEGVAVTAHPGLMGSLLVGLHFAKAFAWALGLPFIAVDHLLAHLYAPRLSLPALPGTGPAGKTEQPAVMEAAAGPAVGDAAPGQAVEYPFLGLLVSGGHSVICRADDFDNITVLGTTIDDAVGEAFDKVSKHYGFGYPGGAVIDKLAQSGDSETFRFPMPNLYKKTPQGIEHRCDFSYSGLKTAVINQLEQFRVRGKAGEIRPEDIAASFQKTAVEILLRGLFRAAEDTGLKTVVAGGGVAANSYLRSRLGDQQEIRSVFPPPELCGDNGAMIAGLGARYLARGDRSPLNVSASARVRAFKRRYP